MFNTYSKYKTMIYYYILKLDEKLNINKLQVEFSYNYL